MSFELGLKENHCTTDVIKQQELQKKESKIEFTCLNCIRFRKQICDLTKKNNNSQIQIDNLENKEMKLRKENMEKIDDLEEQVQKLLTRTFHSSQQLFMKYFQSDFCERIKFYHEQH